MNGVKAYFKNIRDAATTTFAGMKITLRYWLKEPAITVEYPDRLGAGVTAEDLVSERFRGFLAVRPESCIACLQCMRICPIRCIRIAMEQRPEGRMLTRFDVNQARCMHCGLCVEVCPTEAILFTRRFEGACYDINELRFRHVTTPTLAAKMKK